MKPNARLLAQMPLENGLVIYFYDQSRPVAKGRCQVQLLVCIPLELQETYFLECPHPKEAFEKFSAAFGNSVAFEQIKVRNFIAQEDAENLLAAMREDFLRSNLAYLAKPDFAKKYVLKAYGEWERAEASRSAHNQAILSAEQ